MEEKEIENSLREDVITALVAAVTDQEENLRYVREDPPELTLSEAEQLLEKDGISNEAAYLRDSGVIRTEVTEEEVKLILNPDIAPQAAQVRDLKEKYGGLSELAESGEYMKFEAPYEWEVWEGPEKKDEVRGALSYEEQLGNLCALLSMYGEERRDQERLTEFSVDAMEEAVSLEGYDPEFDVEQNLEILEQLGYVERYSTGNLDVYRLTDDEKAKDDAEKIADFREEIYSDIPQNMAVAFERADRVEIQQKGVNLVERPEKQIQ